MSDKKAANETVKPENDSFAAGEMQELKREMRSAKWVAWLEDNKQTLLAGLGVLVLVLLAAGYWLESERSMRVAAATVYQQALTEQDRERKRALLESVSRDFAGSSYAALALMQLARFDAEHADRHLQALIAHGQAMDEWVWQAHLDLAEFYLERGDIQAARQHLKTKVGEQYLQLQHYLQAQAADDAGERKMHLKEALAAPSLDDELKQKIESQLAANAS